MKARRLAPALLSLAALTACSDAALITGAAPTRPAFQAGGIGMGSGGIMPTDTTQAGTTASTTTPVAPDSSDRRGGFGMGSGG